MFGAFDKLSKAEQDLTFPAVPEITFAMNWHHGTLFATLPAGVSSVDFSRL